MQPGYSSGCLLGRCMPHLLLDSLVWANAIGPNPTATKSENVSFTCCIRIAARACIISIIAQRATLSSSEHIWCAASSMSKTIHGYLLKRNSKGLEAEVNRSIDLKEFIPLDSVDPVYFENTQHERRQRRREALPVTAAPAPRFPPSCYIFTHFAFFSSC